MSNRIKASIFFLVAIIIGFFSFQYFITSNDSGKSSNTNNLLPKFSFYTLDNQEFRNKDIAKKHYVLFIYFNTQCDHCYYQAEDIKDNIESLHDVQILFTSNDVIENIKIFASEVELENEPNVQFLSDPTKSYYDLFEPGIIPNIFVYDKSHKLLEHFEGQTEVKNILSILDASVMI
ncbi:MAG: redoxin domain-containing protein [Bacteroidia bacterium]|nr:redoxin domain-containing protein [Bacteroidia bacterium]